MVKEKKVLFITNPDKKENHLKIKMDLPRQFVIAVTGKDPVVEEMVLLKKFQIALREEGAKITFLQGKEKSYKKRSKEAKLIVSTNNLDSRLIKNWPEIAEHIIGNHGKKVIMTGNPLLTKKTIRKLLKGEKITFPKSYNNFSVEDMPVPLVLKVPNTSKGEGVFKVNEKERLKKLFDPEAEHYGIIKRKPRDFIIQEYIDSPSEYYTHYRIFTIGNEPVLGNLHHSTFKKKEGIKRIETKRVHHLLNPDSPIFINSDDIRTNRSIGGKTIPLTKSEQAKKITKIQEKILREHGIDPKNPKVPKKLLQLSKKVATTLRKKGVQYSGQDWLQDKKGKFYLLEVNDAPGMGIFGDHFKKGKGKHEEHIRIGFKHIAKRLMK
ncbi:hypothetical protein K8R43_06095 [archaeon]|nr:hypothetical protein [archaeon]